MSEKCNNTLAVKTAQMIKSAKMPKADRRKTIQETQEIKLIRQRKTLIQQLRMIKRWWKKELTTDIVAPKIKGF